MSPVLEMQDALVRGMNCFVPEQKPSCQIIQTSPRISRLRPGVRFAHTAKDTKTKVAGWKGALWKTSKDYALTRKDMLSWLDGMNKMKRMDVAWSIHQLDSWREVPRFPGKYPLIFFVRGSNGCFGPHISAISCVCDGKCQHILAVCHVATGGGSCGRQQRCQVSFQGCQ